MNTKLAQVFQPRQILPSISAGLVVGIQRIVVAISFAALLFAGPLASHVSGGIGIALFGLVIVGTIVALTSSFPCTVAGPLSSPTAIFALTTAAIAKNMPPSSTTGATVSTIVTMVAITSLLTGVCFLVLGKFKLGNLIRFVPYPVIGGFLAGTGWILIQGAIGTMTGWSLTYSQLDRFFTLDVMGLWLPGVIFGLLLLVTLKRYNHPMILPGMLLSGIVLFDGLLGLTEIVGSGTRAPHWLLGPFPSGMLWQPLTPSALTQVDWSVLAGQMDKVATIIIIGTISLLFNATGIELAVRQEMDLNRELKSAGIANLIAGLGGGLTGYHTTSVSVLIYKTGARGRLAGLISSALCAGVLFFGGSLLAFFPKPVLGGLLIYLGLGFLVEWVYSGWFKLSRTEYALVLVILAVIVGIGFLEGVAVGIAIAIGLFVVNYSRIQVVRHTLSGTNFHSTMDRPPSQRQSLREHGAQLEILQLQGFIFFGTAQTLLDQIRRRVDAPDSPRLRFLVLDFGRTSGLDSSAVSSFVKLKQIAEAHTIQLVLTSLSPEMQCQLERGGLAQSQIVRHAPTLDAGVEWCEDQILATAEPLICDPQDSLQNQLGRMFHRSSDTARLMQYLEKQTVDTGQLLVRQGDPPDALYFIESGLATAQLELPDGRSVRLRTMRCGTIIGEVGLYLGIARTATVLTTEPSTLYRLSAHAIRRMEEQDPEVAAALHKWIARLMAERLAENNTALAAMMD